MALPIALIPYFKIPIYNLGPIPFDPWGILVCIGFMAGLEVARARGIRLGLDVRDIVDGLVFTVLSGFVGGHLVHVLAYHPEQLQTDGIMALLKIWAGFSSFGGFFGAVIGCNVFYRLVRRRPLWPHADAIMFGFPFGWTFGRLGCFSVHDHIGVKSDLFFAVDFPGGPRLDMGLVEAVWTAGIAVTYLALGRRPRPPGFFAMLWCLLYAPARLGFDFLRATDISKPDVRWSGLTPAQWGCVVLIACGFGLLAWMRGRPAVPFAAPVVTGA